MIASADSREQMIIKMGVLYRVRGPVVGMKATSSLLVLFAFHSFSSFRSDVTQLDTCSHQFTCVVHVNSISSLYITSFSDQLPKYASCIISEAHCLPVRTAAAQPKEDTKQSVDGLSSKVVFCSCSTQIRKFQR